MWQLKIKINMTDIELKLKDYLSENIEVIEESLKNSWSYYDFIIVSEVEIDEDYFQAHCLTIKNMSSPSISPFLPIPKKFLRKIKLEQINKK